MSWLPTIRIARAAWKGRQDPAGLLKSQLSGEQPAQAQAQAQTPASLLAPPVAAAAHSAPAVAPVPVAAVVEPVAQPHEHATHTHLLLLLR